MKLLILLSLRNLLRQKRRNLLLGIGIAFGMMVLVVANSFTHGITDLLLNQFIKYAAGHISVTAFEKSNRQQPVIRDVPRVKKIVTNTIDGIEEVREDVSIMTRAIGNGKSDVFVLVGFETDIQSARDWMDQLQIYEGNIYNFTNRAIENPVVIMKKKAEKLNVRVNDQISIKTKTIYGQVQTANLTICAIAEGENEMMAMAGYLNMKDMKKILGYSENEAGSLVINFKEIRNPRIAIQAANKLHDNLAPKLMTYKGMIYAKGKNASINAFAFHTNESNLKKIKETLKITKGNVLNASKRKTDFVMISEKLAKNLNLKIGDTFKTVYEAKYINYPITNEYRLKAVYNGGNFVDKSVVLFSEITMLETFYPNLPKEIKESDIPISSANALYPYLNTEWERLKRTSSSKEAVKKARELSQRKVQSSVYDVSTMYENFEMILTMEKTLTLIAIIGVLVLFFIILIGVFNSLRMTIRERTREIGTTRAIGMQRGEVLWMFIFETSFLALFASIAGTLFSFVVIWLLSLPTFDATGFLAMLLYKGHLHLVVKSWFIVFYTVAIIFISALTAYFPARKAANLSAADALRHFE